MITKIQKKGGGERKEGSVLFKITNYGQMEMGSEIISNREKKIEPLLKYCGKITKQ